MVDSLIYIASCAPDGGIVLCRLDNNYKLERLAVTSSDRPMYLAKDGGYLWSVLREPDGFGGSSAVCRNRIKPDGFLSETEIMGSTLGVVACHLYAENNDVFCVNYLSGSVIKLPDRLVTHNGCGPDAIRQKSPHTHFVGAVPNNNLLCVTDLGTDSIYFYNRDLELKDTVCVPSGYGARHIAFSPDGERMFCVNELVSSVSLFRRNQNRWHYIQSCSTLPNNYKNKSYAAAIRVSNDGRYVYVSNRGHNSIAWLEVSGNGLKLCGTVDCEGDWPRDINIINGAILCANERSNDISVLSIVQGRPVFTGEKLAINTPLCII